MNACLQCEQRTTLPRAVSATTTVRRQFKLGQIIITDIATAALRSLHYPGPFRCSCIGKIRWVRHEGGVNTGSVLVARSGGTMFYRWVPYRYRP